MPLSRRLLALLLLPGVALAACGGDSDDDASRTTTSSTSPTSSTVAVLEPDQVDADASPYCATWKEIREVGGPPLDGTPEEQAEARKAHYARIVPLAERLLEQADDEIRESVEYALAQVREVADTGSSEPFERDDAQEHQQRLAAYAQANCAA